MSVWESVHVRVSECLCERRVNIYESIRDLPECNSPVMKPKIKEYHK